MAQNNFPSIAQVLANRVAFAIQNMKENLVEADAIASNVLNQSIRFDVQIFGTKVEVNIKMEDYWKNVDQGQKPGTRVGVDKILLWMAHKGIGGTTVKQRSRIRGRRDRATVRAMNRQQIAQRIVNKIYRKGTDAKYFASDVITEEWQKRVALQLQAVGAKDVRFNLNVPKETKI